MLCYPMLCDAMLWYAICYAALCYAMLRYAMLCYFLLLYKRYYVIHGNRRSRDFFQLATASSSSANNFFVYCACRLLELYAVCEKTRLFSHGSVHGDVMRRRVRSRAVIARIVCVHFDFYVHYVREFPQKKLRNVNNRKHCYYTVLEMLRSRVLVYGEP